MKQEKNNQKNEKQIPLRQFGGTYFHAGVIIGRKNIFVTNEYIDLLINAFKLAELKKDIKNLAYVIMPNFFYWVFKLSSKQDDPVAIYGDLKKNVAGEILNNLRQEKKIAAYKVAEIFKSNERVGRSSPEKILWTFEEKAKEFKENQRYRVWTPKTGIRLLDNQEAIAKKIALIKGAPISARWQLAKTAEEYPYLYICDEYSNNVNLPEKDLKEVTAFLQRQKASVSV